MVRSADAGPADFKEGGHHHRGRMVATTVSKAEVDLAEGAFVDVD